MRKNFIGTVNGKKFTNETEMDKYINECEKNNIQITSVTMNSQVIDEDVVDEKSEDVTPCCGCKDTCSCTLNKKICEKCEEDIDIPSPYKSVEEYLSAELNYDSFKGVKKEDDVILDDTCNKLYKRLDYLRETLLPRLSIEKMYELYILLDYHRLNLEKKREKINSNKASIDNDIDQLNLRIESLLKNKKDLIQEKNMYEAMDLAAEYASDYYKDAKLMLHNTINEY